MSILQAVILGIVQGLSEFLPISSSGHLVLLQKLFGIEEGTMTFSVLLHLATLIPVCVIYRQTIWELIRNPFQKMTLFLILGTLPAVGAALFLDDFIESLFTGGIYLAFGFVITGCLLIFADSIPEGRKKVRHMSGIDALFIGFVQAIAITPAISRSGSTITASLFRRLDRSTAARFSFLLSVPAILGSAVLEVKKILDGGGGFQEGMFLPYTLGFLAAMLAGFLAIQFMLALIQQCRLKIFSVYVFLLAAFLFLDHWVIHFIQW